MLLIYGIIRYIVKVNKWVLHLLFLMTLSGSRMHMLIRPDKNKCSTMAASNSSIICSRPLDASYAFSLPMVCHQLFFCITKRHGDVQAPSSVQSSSSYYRSLTHSDQRTAGYTDHLLVCSMVWFLSPKEGVPLQTKTRTVKSKPVLALQGSLKWSLQKNGATSNNLAGAKN